MERKPAEFPISTQNEERKEISTRAAVQTLQDQQNLIQQVS